MEKTERKRERNDKKATESCHVVVVMVPHAGLPRKTTNGRQELFLYFQRQEPRGDTKGSKSVKETGLSQGGSLTGLTLLTPSVSAKGKEGETSLVEQHVGARSFCDMTKRVVYGPLLCLVTI